MSSWEIMLVYFDKERHVFEGFCVPDLVCRYWVREEERDQEKGGGRERGNEEFIQIK